MLTEQQRAHFDTFGFVIFKQLFTPAETAEITRNFDDVMAEQRNGEPFPGDRRQMILSLVEQRDELARLLEDDRIYGIAEDVVGPNFVWIAGDGNLYVGDTQWHPDAGKYPIIKVAFYLDPVREDSGCLRVIPGSHKEPLHSDLKVMTRHRETPPVYPFGAKPEDIPAFPLESDPGDVVMFNQNLWHSSFGGSTHRRMFTLNFAKRPESAEDEAWFRWVYDINLNFVKKMTYGPRDHVYNPRFLTGGGPRRQSMVKSIVEWGFK